MQAEARNHSYNSRFANANKYIISCRQHDVGTLWTMRSASAFHFIDIAVLPEFQRLGIGSAVFKSLIDTAISQATPLRFQVEKSNIAAIEFYMRHGCTVISDDGVYLACQHTLQKSAGEDQSKE